jgi:hypothetical protein
VLELLDGIAELGRSSFCIAKLLSTPPLIHFSTPEVVCPSCGGALKVSKTKPERLVYTLHVGAFYVHETWKICVNCATVYRSKELQSLLPAKCNFGYDVIVLVGQRLFLDNRTLVEIKSELAAAKVHISENGISFLGCKFIAYLSLAHRRAANRVKAAMERNSGYMLHIDATCDGGGPMLLSGMDAITSIVLWNSKIPTEKADNIIPFLQEVKELYGDPLLIVADMGKGINAAVREVFGEDMRLLICHFHFLRDIGKDLLSTQYEKIRSLLRKHGVGGKLRYRLRTLRKVVEQNPRLAKRLDSDIAIQGNLTDEEKELLPELAVYFLIQWALAGKGSGDAYGFPFDRPHLTFALRIKEVSNQLVVLKEMFGEKQYRYNHPFVKASNDIRPIVEDKGLWQTVDKMESQAQVFDKLRKAMRIAPRGAKKGLNDGGSDEPTNKIEARVRKFMTAELKNTGMKDTSEHKKMIKQLKKYWDRLFADPVVIDTPDGRISIQPQRTNNIMEQFFREIKRDYRRKTGNNSMARKLGAMNANTPLVKNLNNKQYMDILLDDCKCLEEVFSRIEADDVHAQMRKESQIREKIPAKMRKMMRSENFPQMMLKSIKSMIK